MGTVDSSAQARGRAPRGHRSAPESNLGSVARQEGGCISKSKMGSDVFVSQRLILHAPLKRKRHDALRLAELDIA